MTDRISKAARSHVMQSIRGRNTTAELMVYRYLRRHKIYFQKQYRMGRFSLDIALPRKKVAVFIDGDFWHGRELEVRKDRLPVYWAMRLTKNVKRDRSHRAQLKADGWKVLRVWEGDLRNAPDEQLDRIVEALSDFK